MRINSRTGLAAVTLAMAVLPAVPRARRDGSAHGDSRCVNCGAAEVAAAHRPLRGRRPRRVGLRSVSYRSHDPAAASSSPTTLFMSISL